MPIFYDYHGSGKAEEHDVRPEGYTDAPNGWVDPDYVPPPKVVKKTEDNTELKAKYEEKFGKKPHHKMKEASIKKALDAS